METRFCTLCRNHCSLDHPKCPEVLTDEMLAQRAAQEGAAGDCCQLCGNHCPYTALRCETGKTMARIKGKLPAAE